MTSTGMHWLVGLAWIGLTSVAMAVPQDLVELAGAARLEDSHLGEAGTPSRTYARYLDCRKLLDHLTWTEVRSLLSGATPAGKVYLAMLGLELGRDEGFSQMAGQSDRLYFQSGCEVVDTDLAEVSKAFLQQGEYLDFAPPQVWRTWKAGKLLAVEVADSLYRDSEKHLFLKFRYRNLVSRPLGLDPLQGLWLSQWSVSSQSRRQVVDERRPVVESMTGQHRLDLVQGFQEGRLVKLPPHFSRALFVGFAGPGPQSLADGESLIVSPDGRCRVSDGQSCEQVGRGAQEFSETDLSWPRPLRFRPLPRQAPKSL